MRYTEKKRSLPRVDKDGTEHYYEYIDVADKNGAEEKLFRLETYEEILGIDLDSFLNALEPNTLFRCMPFEKAKVIDDFRRKFIYDTNANKNNQ